MSSGLSDLITLKRQVASESLELSSVLSTDMARTRAQTTPLVPMRTGASRGVQ